MRDHYEVLQVNPRADQEVIRAAYRVLARKYHPDHGGDNKLMIELNDAWDVLGDPERRAAYDSARANANFGRRRDDPTPPQRSPADGVATPASEPAAGAARAGTTWAPPDIGTRRAGPAPGFPSGSVLNFGQYAGWSLGEIVRHDVNYLEWLVRSPSGRKYRLEIDELLRQYRRPSAPQPPRSRFGR